MNECILKCENLNTGDNKYDVMIASLEKEICELCKTSTAKFLLYDGKVSELCTYIKDNLSNAIRCLIADMKSAGEIDTLINSVVLPFISNFEIGLNDIQNKTAGIITPQMYGACGDGVCDDTNAFKRAIENCGNNQLYIPKTEKEYKVSHLDIENIPCIKIDGVINATDGIDIKCDINSTERPDISIYKAKGKITLKGINTGKVRIGKCDTLELISDDREEFIGYTSFELGDVINLIIKTSGTGWINENIFTGGRLTNVNINGNLAPEDNLFIKPMFENARVDIIKGYRNRFINCRFEGTNTINLSDNTYGNYFEKTFFTVPILMYAKYQDYDINFNDSGDNFLVRNTGTTSYPLISINKFNNPYNLPIDTQGNIVPATKWARLFVSDLVEIPDTNICLEFINPSKNVDFRLTFYDANKTVLTKTDAVNATQLSHNSNGDYSLASGGITKAMALIYGNKSAKYVKISVLGIGSEMCIDELEVRVSAKNDVLIQKFIDGFKTPIAQ